VPAGGSVPWGGANVLRPVAPISTLRCGSRTTILSAMSRSIAALACREVFSGARRRMTMMKVQRLLTGPMGLRVTLEGNGISVSFTDASTRVRVTVQDWGKNKDGDPSSLVQLTCPILWEVEPVPALYEWIARQGGTYYFGHVVAFDDSTSPGKVFLMMSHTLLGDYLDEGELSATLYAILGTADQLDDELKEKFGGKRLADYA
jgi:hypothetical protein